MELKIKRSVTELVVKSVPMTRNVIRQLDRTTRVDRGLLTECEFVGRISAEIVEGKDHHNQDFALIICDGEFMLWNPWHADHSVVVEIMAQLPKLIIS